MENDRLRQALDLTDELLADIELERIPIASIALKASRLARLVEDDDAQAWLELELGGYESQDSQRFVESANISGRWADQARGTGYWEPVGHLDATIRADEARLEALTLPNLSGDSIARTTTSVIKAQADVRKVIGHYVAMRSRIQSHLYKIVARHYYELRFSAQQAAVFDDARLKVDQLLAPLAVDAIDKVDSIYQRLAEGDGEAVSQALTTCRRLIDSVADEIQPPTSEIRTLSGNDLKLTKQHTQNRINVFIHDNCTSTSRRTKLRRTLNDLYDRVNTGVHSDVTAEESRYLFLGTYLFLGEVLGLATDSTAVSKPES